MLDDLRSAVNWMTPGRWYPRGRFISLRPDNTGMGATLHTNHVAVLAERGDSDGIAALRNHADALLDLVDRCDEVLEESQSRYESQALRDLRAARARLESAP